MEALASPAHRIQLRRLARTLGVLLPVGPRDVREGIATCLTLGNHSIPSTLSKFGVVGDSPVALVEEFRKASHALRRQWNDGGVYFSLKPPVLEFNLQHVAEITECAFQNNQRAHFDSHGHDVADPTIALLGKLLDEFPPSTAAGSSWCFGLTIPSRWKRSRRDAIWIIERGIRPRLVKGEFKAARSDEIDPRQGFLDLVDLLAGSVPALAIATHDHSLAADAIARCRGSGTEVELELLFGVPADNMICLAIETATPMRFYVPYGDTLLAYGLRHFATHPHKLLRPRSIELLTGTGSKLSRILRVASSQDGWRTVTNASTLK